MDINIREAIINEDLGFLNDIGVEKIDDKLVLTDGDLPINVETVMYEKEFLKDWIMGFALGNYHGINYFNSEKWFGVSANGVRSVLVVDDNHKPVLLVPPLISHNLKEAEFQALRAASLMIQHSASDTMKKSDPNANHQVAKQIEKQLEDTKRLTLTDLVNPEFFKKHGINPLVEQQVYYVKDNINGNKIAIEDINKLRVILYKNFNDEKLTTEEKDLVKVLSQDTFKLNDEAPEKKEKEAVKKETPDNPFEC